MAQATLMSLLRAMVVDLRSSPLSLAQPDQRWPTPAPSTEEAADEASGADLPSHVWGTEHMPAILCSPSRPPPPNSPLASRSGGRGAAATPGTEPDQGTRPAAS